MDKHEILKYREFLWNYFSLHADQRLKTFNFYIIVSAIFTSAFINIIKDDSSIFTSMVPLLLTFTSFIFWKLDLRTKQMIKNVESIIIKVDAKILSNIDETDNSSLNIFKIDEEQTNKYRKNKHLFNGHYSYSKCFNLIFFVFGLLGMSIALRLLLIKI